MLHYRLSKVHGGHGRWLVGLLTIATGMLFAAHARGEEFMAGGDISALSVLEDHGAVYYDGGTAGDAIDMFRDHGMNWFRLRLFVDPNGDGVVVNDLDYTIALAQRAKASGAKLLLDFHYSDTWADPGKQYKPAAWNSLSFSQLETRVHDYTRDVMVSMKANGVLPEMVQIGNEIANGMLWEDGRLWRSGVSENTEFNNLAALVSAGINGANDGAGPGDEPLIMIHHDKGANWGTTSYYLDRLLPRLQSNGTDIDMIGYSYYPKWHYDEYTGDGGIDDVEQNLNNTAATYGKPVAIVEAGFPWTGQQWEPDYEFDVSTAGQEQFLQALVDTVEAVPNDLGRGVFWWYPEAKWVNGIDVWEGGRYSLFDYNGNLLPAIDVFADLNPTTPGDYNEDGIVDSADYTIWRDTLGSTSDLRADGNDNGVIDTPDYTVWKTNYGSTSGTGALVTSTSVPEPGAAILWAMCLALLVRASRRP